MALAGNLLRVLARGFRAVSDAFRRVADVLNGLLPALLSPSELTSGVSKYYGAVYSEQLARWAEHDQLDAWEVEVLDRYHVARGRALVLGSGWGRESLALARRGLSVVGIDTNETAVRTAQRRAQAACVSARFHGASFLDLPYRSASWDYVLLADSMYSANPGVAGRQRLLAEIVRVLRPDGVLMLSFLPEHRPVARIKRLATALSTVLVTLPGTNQSYQRGDDCLGGHFLHAFQDEAEVSAELHEAGVVIREVNWHRGFAVVSRASR